jgi:hypothetical protein
MISRDEILMGRDKQYPLTGPMEVNLEKLLKAVNKFRAVYGKPLRVTSGYRPAAINSQVKGAAKASNHMVCLAVDLADSGGKLAEYCLNNLKLLEEFGLWMEDPGFTKGWVHLQCVPPRSGSRVFKP